MGGCAGDTRKIECNPNIFPCLTEMKANKSFPLNEIEPMFDFFPSLPFRFCQFVEVDQCASEHLTGDSGIQLTRGEIK